MTNGYEILVVLLIIAFTLYVGIMASKGVTDIRSFAISRDYFGSFAITCTIVASFIGGASIIGTAEKSFHQGLAPVSAWLGFCLQLILTATVIVPRLDKFIDTISVGDIIQTAYGRKAKILTGVIWVLFCTGIIVAQTKALGSIIGIFSSLGADINSIIGLCIVISYCYLGGIRSVVATDILQFIVMFIALPIMLIFAMNHIGGFSGILERVPKDYFEISGSISAGEVAFLFLGFAFGDALIPPMIQRLIMASHSKKAKRSIFIASVLIIPLYAIGGLLGMIAFALNPELHHSDIMPYLFRTVLTPGITGLAVAGLMAAIMSSADSYLNSASIALVHDVIKPLSRGAISKEYELKLARATTVLIGFAAIFLIAIGAARRVLKPEPQLLSASGCAYEVGIP